MKSTSLPIFKSGPGSQDDNEEHLDYLRMPSEMETYAPPLLPEKSELIGKEPAIALLSALHKAISQFKSGRAGLSFSLAPLDQTNRELIDQVLGEGEVSIVFEKGTRQAKIQETRLAGIWRCHETDSRDNTQSDFIELASIPEIIRRRTFLGAATHIEVNPSDIPEGVINAPSLLTELNGQIARVPHPGQTAHVINLSLLPFSAEDQQFTETKLGTGPSLLLSRGYGNCRISATATASIWWVQYFNSSDSMILNTLEVAEVPQVACAAQEDINDSAERLHEILEHIA